MVRWPSGVTLIRQRPVGVASCIQPPAKRAPMASMSWAKTSPNWSRPSLPMCTARPPKLATPATVLPAEPPDASIAAAMRL